jgi:hypothetical protein
LIFRDKKLVQCAHSSKAYFSCYLFEPGKREIIRIIDDTTANNVLNWIKDRIKELESMPVKSTKSTRKNNKESKKQETPEDLEKRISEMSPKSLAIHVENVTPEIQTWAEEKQFKIENNNLFVRGL